MGGRSSKTKPAAAQADTVVESFSPADGADDVASASGKRTPVPQQDSQQRVVKEIWNSKHVEVTSDATSAQPSPKKRLELQISSEEDSDAGQKSRALAKKKSKKKRRKGSREQEPAQKASTIKLNEVQVIKKPPDKVSPERQQRFEQIKVAYSMRDLASMTAVMPSPSRAESKAESLARFFGGRDSKPSVPTVVTDVVPVSHSKANVSVQNRPPSSCSPPYQSESSPRPQKQAHTAHSEQTKGEQVLQFNARQSERKSMELLDVDLEREELTAVPVSRFPLSSFQRTTLTPASKAIESRSASLPTPQSQTHRLKSPALGLRLDDADESIMSAILMEVPPRTGSIDIQLT